MEKEIWIDIPGFEGYYKASNFGRIKSLYKVLKILRYGKWYNRSKYEKILRCKSNKDGYFRLKLRDNQLYFVHELILRTFKGVCVLKIWNAVIMMVIQRITI